MVATGCARGGGVGIFSRSGGDWRAEGPVLGGALVGASTTVLRLETAGATAKRPGGGEPAGTPLAGCAVARRLRMVGLATVGTHLAGNRARHGRWGRTGRWPC